MKEWFMEILFPTAGYTVLCMILAVIVLAIPAWLLFVFLE